MPTLPGLRTAAVFLGVAAALLAAGCGGSGGSSKQAGSDSLEQVLKDVEGLTGKAREAKLLSLAAKEGDTLTLYTSQGSSKADATVSAFGDAYGDIDVALYRANSETILPRLAEESKAGFHGADVVHVQGLAMTSLHQDGLIDDYDSPAESDLVPGAVKNGWVLDSLNSFVVSWNTKLVPAGQQPHSWEDLADPRWKGKLAIEGGDVDWYKTLHDYFVKDEGKSEQEADRLFESIVRNALIVRGHTNMAQLMAAGEFAVGVNYDGTVDGVRKDGAPITWHPPVTPLIQEPEGTALAKDAPHPAAAMLWVDWLLSHDGQKALVATGVESVRKDLAVVPQDQTKLIDVDTLAPVAKKWSDRYDRLLRLGKEAPSS